MRGLRIILDKSAVYGLNNEEVDSLDRYFFQVVPHILVNEILADLSKGSESSVTSRIAANTYRVSGNHGLTFDYGKRLVASLLGDELPMDGRFLPSQETVVRTASGSLATIVETPLEDQTLARWERQDFTETKQAWAQDFRVKTETALNVALYLEKIRSAKLSFTVPTSDKELINNVNGLLSSIKLVPQLFDILGDDLKVPSDVLVRAGQRWSAQGPATFEEFAPFALFCLKASFLWHLSQTNPALFKPDKNDRKDLEYCFYLPNTQIFATKDSKQLRLMAGLVRGDQSLVNAEELKRDLEMVSEDWNRMDRHQRIALNARRGSAPPDNPDSLLFKLWKAHDGKLNVSRVKEVSAVKWVDTTLPKDEQIPFTLGEFAKKKYREVREGVRLTQQEIDQLKIVTNGADTTTIRVFDIRTSRERLIKWHPELAEKDIEEEMMNQIYLDPSEYKGIVSC